MGGFAALLALVSAIGLVGSAVPSKADPGVPQAPTVIYSEDFQNAPVTGATRIASYVSTSGISYTASPVYLNASLCNGVVHSRQTTNAAFSAISFCGASSSWWPFARSLASAIGLYRDMADPTSNLVVAEQTVGGTSNNYTGTMLEGTGIALSGSGRYVTFSLDVANYCGSGMQAQDRFSLLDGATVIPLNTVDYSICSDPARQTFTVDGRVVSVGTFTGNQAALVTSPTIGFRLANQQASGSGNDQSFDNFRILDVTPQLDKAFATPNPISGVSTLTFTVTNTSELASKAGWSAVDTLEAGLEVASPSNASSTCVNNSIDAVPGSQTIEIAGDLQQGQTSCTFTVDVAPSVPTAPGAPAQVFQNCATNVTTSGLNPPQQCATVSFTPVAELSVAKTSTATVDTRQGDVIDYEITVTNTGGSPYTSSVPATVTDDLSAVLDDATYNGDATATAVDQPSYLAPDLSWSGPLGVGESVTIAYSMTATLAGDTVLTNAACVPPEQAPSPEEACSTTTTTIPRAPSIDLVKSGSPLTVTVGTPITYTFVTTNTGNVNLEDPLITETDFNGANPAGMSALDCGAAPPTTLVPGAQLTCTATYVPVQADVDGAELTNTATASGIASAEGTVTSAPSSVTLPAVPEPSISIEKTAGPGGFTRAGQIVDYRFLLTNTGNVTLTDAEVIEDSFSGSGTLSAPECPAAAESMAPGAQVTCTATYTLTQADVDAGQVTNAAISTGTPPSGPAVVSDPDDAVVTIAAAPAITLLKSAAGGPFTRAGQVVEYSFDVANAGNVTLTAIGIAETAFSGTGTVPSAVCGAATLAPTDTTTCTASYTLSQQDVDAGVVSNTATSLGTPPSGPAVTSAPSDAVVPITPTAAIALVKSVDREVVAGAGESLRYSFLITNTGESSIDDIAVTEVTFTGTGDLTTPECPVSRLAPGASTTCTADYRLTPADAAAGSVNNTATVTGTSSFGAAVTSAPSTAAVTVDPAAALAHTGSTILQGAAIAALAALAAGLALLVVRRRTRT